MKNIILIVGLFILSGMTSCKKYLETKPTDFLNPTNYYTTPQQLEFARRGVYSALGETGLYGRYTQYLLGWTADEGYFNRSSSSGPFNYRYSASDSYNLRFWSTLYDGINRANVLIANVDNNREVDQTLRDKLRGEALFLRGYYYFLLVQYYGGVPLRLASIESVNNVNFPKSSVREVYDQILKDMTAAEPLVPGIRELGFGGAISKSAVRGILARVNLYMGGAPLKDQTRFVEAKKWAKMVMDDAGAGHRLNPSYSDIFSRLAGDKYDVQESIWEVEFHGGVGEQYNETGNQGWNNGPVSSAASATGRADAFVSLTAKLYDVYEDGDLRKWFNTVGHFVYSGNENGQKRLTGLPTTNLAKYNLRPGKWRREYETLIPKHATTTPQNVPILRFTDVLMMYAEADNEINNGPTPEAIEIVNSIRRRVWSTGIKSITITNTGANYTSVPTVLISGGGGAQALAVRSTSTRRLTAINLVRDSTTFAYFKEGSYNSAPTITITGGGGSGATAVANMYSLTDADVKHEFTVSKQKFLEFIQNERMREFCFELSRKADLLRWGIFLDVHQDMADRIAADAPTAWYKSTYGNVTPKDLLMPIPTNEVSINTAMVQNPGWN